MNRGLHSILQDCWVMLRFLILCTILHVCKEANNAINWMASYIADHMDYMGLIL